MRFPFRKRAEKPTNTESKKEEKPVAAVVDLKAIRGQIDRAVALVRQASAKLAEKDTEIAGLKTQIGEKDTRITELEGQVAALNSQAKQQGDVLQRDSASVADGVKGLEEAAKGLEQQLGS